MNAPTDGQGERQNVLISNLKRDLESHSKLESGLKLRMEDARSETQFGSKQRTNDKHDNPSVGPTPYFNLLLAPSFETAFGTSF